MKPPNPFNVIDRHGGYTILETKGRNAGGTLWCPGNRLGSRSSVGALESFDEASFYQVNNDVTIRALSLARIARACVRLVRQQNRGAHRMSTKRKPRVMTYAHAHSSNETRMYYVEHQKGDTPIDTLARAQNFAAWLVGRGYEARAFRFYEIAMLSASRTKGA